MKNLQFNFMKSKFGLAVIVTASLLGLSACDTSHKASRATKMQVNI